MKMTLILFTLLIIRSQIADAQNNQIVETPAVSVYKTKVQANAEDVIKLENGGVIQISNYYGYIGIYKTAFLFKQQNQWKVWIEDQKVSDCDLLKQPLGNPSKGFMKYLLEVSGDGEILKMRDGSIYEVGILDRIFTGLWLGYQEVLIYSGTELINLGENKVIRVNRLK